MSSYGPTNYGILGGQAPSWGVETWFNLADDRQRLDIDDFKGKVLYLYCFQSWCPGCHSSGFPTLQAMMRENGDDQNVAYVAIQTVFEGFDQNTLEKAQEVARKYALDIPFGHDPGPDGSRSVIMQRYRTGGTPWIILIGSDGLVRFNDFHADPGMLKRQIDHLARGL
jgi:thiol-disulfide isomerase/thioredoxin